MYECNGIPIGVGESSTSNFVVVLVTLQLQLLEYFSTIIDAHQQKTLNSLILNVVLIV